METAAESTDINISGTMIIMMASIGFGLFGCGICIACCILRDYRKKK